MNDIDTLFRSAAGLDLTTARTLVLVSGIGVMLLYLYRLLTVIHCMSQPVAQFSAAIDRLIWVGLAIFVPLGLGAWVYDVVHRGRFFPLLFIVPFAAVAVCFFWFMIPVWQRATNFKFDFLGI